MRDAWEYAQLLSRDPASLPMRASVTEDVHDIQAQRRLQADVYLARGFVSPEEVSEGVLSDASDPHREHATYFRTVSDSGRLLITGRQLLCQLHPACDDLPVLRHADVDPEWRARLTSGLVGPVVELSALARARGSSTSATLLLYKAMWQHSTREAHGYWVMACEPRLQQRLTTLFGDNVRTIGSRSSYTGGDVIPTAMCVASVNAYLRHKARSRVPSLRRTAARFFLDGLR